MTARCWSLSELERYLRYEDPEVRFWAADRLTRHYRDEATSLLAPYLFDEHDATPELVANHLGKHGSSRHAPHLERGVRTLRGMPAALALQALVRLRVPEAMRLVEDAFDRRDFDEGCWSNVLEAVAERSDADARRALGDFLQKRTDWVGSPSILRSALRHTEAGEYRPVLQAWLRSLQWRGAGGRGDNCVGEAFRVLMDHLQIDDCGWCFRTGLDGRIDLPKTLKAIESSYDCDLRAGIGSATCDRLSSTLRAGAYDKIAAALGETVRQRAVAVRGAVGDDLPDRIVEVVSFWADPDVARAAEGLGPHLREWAICFLLSAVIMMARYRNYELDVRRSEGNLEALLPLMEIETSVLVEILPHALKRAVEGAGGAGSAARSAARRAVEERALAILAARGPFFPQAVALGALGEIRAVGAISEIMDFLAEENVYLCEAAEQALSQMADAVIEPARVRLEAHDMDEEALHSLLVILCEQGTPEALDLVLRYFDEFVEAAGAGSAARWASLFGARELIEPLRDHLRHDVAHVGQALLLLAGIHNLRIPEEAEIRRAIETHWRRQMQRSGSSDERGPDDESNTYVM